MSWCWVSFADPNLQEGKQFLGAVLTDKLPFLRQLGLNPGGEMMIVDLPEGAPLPPEEFRNVLMTREQVDDMDRVMGAL